MWQGYNDIRSLTLLIGLLNFVDASSVILIFLWFQVSGFGFQENQEQINQISNNPNEIPIIKSDGSG
jgi:hypothetical protein